MFVIHAQVDAVSAGVFELHLVEIQDDIYSGGVCLVRDSNSDFSVEGWDDFFAILIYDVDFYFVLALFGFCESYSGGDCAGGMFGGELFCEDIIECADDV